MHIYSAVNCCTAGNQPGTTDRPPNPPLAPEDLVKPANKTRIKATLSITRCRTPQHSGEHDPDTLFNSLHVMFESRYNELWLAADEIAERIRTLDVFAPGSYSQFGKLSSVKEEAGVPDWGDMVAQLVEGHEIVAHTARGIIKAASEAGDEGTADMVTGRLKEHEKTAWMLRSLLK